MLGCWLQVPHFHFCEEVDVGRLVELREELRGDPALGGIKLTYMPFFIKVGGQQLLWLILLLM